MYILRTAYISNIWNSAYDVDAEESLELDPTKYGWLLRTKNDKPIYDFQWNHGNQMSFIKDILIEDVDPQLDEGKNILFAISNALV